MTTDEQEFLADRQPHCAQHHHLMKTCVVWLWHAACSWRIAKRVAGEFQERVLEIGAMDVEFDDLVANLDGAANHVGHLVERAQGGCSRETVEDRPRQFADAGDSVGPSGRQRFLGHDFDPRFRSRQCDQFAVGTLRDYFPVIDQYDSVA